MPIIMDKYNFLDLDQGNLGRDVLSSIPEFVI